MNTPAFSALSARNKSSAENSYFAAHPMGQIVRSLFASSALWVFIAIAVYTVYSMIVPAP